MRRAERAVFRAVRRPLRALFRAELLAALPPALFRAVLRPLRALLRAERLADLPAFRAAFLPARADFLAARLVDRLVDFRRGAAVSDRVEEDSSKSNEREGEGVEGVLSEGRGSIHPETDQTISI